MNASSERRTEQRLQYYWPIWFAENFNGMLNQGQMVDISSRAAAFTCYADERCPHPDKDITARFSVPCYGPEDSFDMADFTRSGHVFRVDTVSSYLRRVAVQFAEPLPFKPGEQPQSRSEAKAEEALEPAAV